jgi:hypothetical protein
LLCGQCLFARFQQRYWANSSPSKPANKLPQLQLCWQATRAAADSLDAQLPYPLSQALDDAIRSLEEKPFGVRIREARAQAESEHPPSKR